MNTKDIKDDSFRAAVEAVDSGNVLSLRQLLEADASLAIRRLDSPAEGYFARPYLLWFVADNPIRQERLPANIVEVAEVILLALRGYGDPSYSHIVEYTLGLVCTGRKPRECEVQIPLMELLVRYGARVKGSVLGAIGQHNFEAARWLLSHGSVYDVATAVGLGDVEGASRLAAGATASQLYVALVVAAFFGRVEGIALLLAAGAGVNGSGSAADFGGFHSHASPLHQAVYSGSLEAVKLLVEAGADVTAMDSAYHGTPLGWAKHMGEEASIEEEKERFREIEGYLKGRGLV
ncbi:MAG TPA: ankyrin repeat domain-containing protein [Puia sp.]